MKISVAKSAVLFYFRSHLLEQINSPIVLALDEVNQIFEQPQVAKRFFLPMLRSWYEEARKLPIWQKLHLIVVHSTEIVHLQLNQSPFNVGFTNSS